MSRHVVGLETLDSEEVRWREFFSPDCLDWWKILFCVGWSFRMDRNLDLTRLSFNKL